MSLLNLSPTDTHEKWYYMTFFYDLTFWWPWPLISWKPS